MPVSDGSTRQIWNISEMVPGDILLSRIPMDLENESTWDSHLIQALTRSRFSFAALCVREGLLIEAVGSGLARLPVFRAGISDSRNVRILRPRPEYRWAADGAAACGLRYLEQGFYRAGQPKPKCTAFQDIKRAAANHSDMVVGAYRAAGLAMDTLKSCSDIFPGDLVDSTFFEDVTQKVLKRSAPSAQAVFNLDDESMRKRIHHWEAETQLKALCKYEVRRILELKSARPSSLSELESLIAKNQWRSLDAALHHTLHWYRFDKIFQAKQNQLLGNLSILWMSEAAAIGEDTLDGDIENGEFKLLEMEADYCRKQRDRYRELIGAYKASSFLFMHDLFSAQENRLSGLVRRLTDRKYKRLLAGVPVPDYLPHRIQRDAGLIHKKYYEVN